MRGGRGVALGWVGLSRLEKRDGPVNGKGWAPRERRNHGSSLSTLRHQKEDDRTTHLPAALGAYCVHRSLVSHCWRGAAPPSPECGAHTVGPPLSTLAGSLRRCRARTPGRGLGVSSGADHCGAAGQHCS